MTVQIATPKAELFQLQHNKQMITYFAIWVVPLNLLIRSLIIRYKSPDNLGLIVVYLQVPYLCL